MCCQIFVVSSSQTRAPASWISFSLDEFEESALLTQLQDRELIVALATITCVAIIQNKNLEPQQSNIILEICQAYKISRRRKKTKTEKTTKHI